MVLCSSRLLGNSAGFPSFQQPFWLSRFRWGTTAIGGARENLHLGQLKVPMYLHCFFFELVKVLRFIQLDGLDPHFSIWRFPEMGVPPNHPFLDGIFPSKPSIVGYPHHILWLVCGCFKPTSIAGRTG